MCDLCEARFHCLPVLWSVRVSGSPAAEHENDPGAMAIVHYPGTEMVLGSFHPMGALYNEAVSISRARQAVLDLVSTLSANKVKVVSVGEEQALANILIICTKGVIPAQITAVAALAKLHIVSDFFWFSFVYFFNLPDKKGTVSFL